MGNDNQLVFIKRNWVDRQTLKVRAWLELLAESLVTEYGLDLTVLCPHCTDDIHITETVHFGKTYELTCGACERKLTVTIPPIIVNKGLIEEVIHGKSR